MNMIIQQLLARNPLSKAQSEALFGGMDAMAFIQQAVIFSLLAAKGESVNEVIAARDYVLRHSTFDPKLVMQCPDNLIDLVGTGGDGKGTFNVSTAASILVASCGVPVAKHGGGRVRSASGSTDVIRALTIPCYSKARDIVISLNKYRYVYLNALHFNPLFQQVKFIRSQLGFPTIFNLLGPLTNPLVPKRHVIGVYRRDLVPLIASVLKETGSIRALVVHADSGMDELSVCGPNYVAEVNHHAIKEYVLCPRELGFSHASLSALQGGTPIENAGIIRAILHGTLDGPKKDIVLLNAAAGLLVAEHVPSFSKGIEKAQEAITSGAAGRLLTQLGGIA